MMISASAELEARCEVTLHSVRVVARNRLISESTIQNVVSLLILAIVSHDGPAKAFLILVTRRV